jgi:hypothetical protein
VYSEALQFVPEQHQQAFRYAIRALVAQNELNQMRLEKELDVLKERSEKELDVLKERSEKELGVKQNELDVMKERSEKELDVLKERSEKEVALLKCELKHERLERDRVQGVLSLRSAIERVEGAPQNEFGSSKQRSQKWQHFFGATRNGKKLFASVKAECFPNGNLIVKDVANLVQRLYKLLSEQVHNTGGQLVGGKIYFCAPSWVAQDQKCLLRAIVREAYGKEAVIALDRPVEECESDSCESSPDGP